MLLWKKISELTIGTSITLPHGQVFDKTRGIGVGAARQITTADAGRLIRLDTAAGSTATLPKATGTGLIYRFVVSVLATSNSHIIKVGNATDGMIGGIVTSDDTSTNANAFFAATAGTDDTITLNRTTTGSVTRGEYIEVEDVSPGVFLVRGTVSNTGTSATPFSATVS